MKKIILLSLLTLKVQFFLSQNFLLVNPIPHTRSTYIQVLDTTGQKPVLEVYRDWHHNIWFSWFDTLIKIDSGKYQGKRLIVDPSSFFPVNRCDTILSMIRNEAWAYNTHNKLDKMMRKEIGFDEETYKSIKKNIPYWPVTRKMCHDDYKALVDSVAKKETEKILVRRNEKLNRLNWVLSNPDKVTTDYIKNFLLDFSTGETDKRTAVQLMRSNTDQFLIACKLIDDVDFQSVKIGLSDLPKDIKTDDVVLKIRNSKIRTGRKKKLIRKLKKNSGLEIRFN